MWRRLRKGKRVAGQGFRAKMASSLLLDSSRLQGEIGACGLGEGKIDGEELGKMVGM